jgi:hypothetical protein
VIFALFAFSCRRRVQALVLDICTVWIFLQWTGEAAPAAQRQTLRRYGFIQARVDKSLRLLLK